MAGKAGSAQFTVLSLDGKSLLGAKVQEFHAIPEVLLEKTDGLGDAWEEHTPTGLRKVTITQGGAYFDTVLAGMHEALSAMPMGARTLIASPDGGILYIAKGTLTTAYEVLGNLGKLTKANVEYVVSGALEVGAMVQAPDVKTATWTGTAVDNLAPTTLGGAASQETLERTGTINLSGKIQHSTDNTTYVDLVVFGPVSSAPNSQAMPVVGTIHRYIRFVGTVTGTGTVRVVAGLRRN
jgi:hypothetical protein